MEEVGIYGSHHASTMMVELDHRLYFAAGSDKSIKLTAKDDLEMSKVVPQAGRGRLVEVGFVERRVTLYRDGAMAEEVYVAFKRFICRLFSAKYPRDVHGDVAVSSRPSAIGGDGVEDVIISDAELCDYVEQLHAYADQDALAYAMPTRYERVVQLDDYVYSSPQRFDRMINSAVDERNGVHYRIEGASVEMCLLLLMRLALRLQSGEVSDSVVSSLALRVQFAVRKHWKDIDTQQGYAIGWDEILRRCLRLFSVVVETESARGEAQLKSLADSFAFTVMYRGGRFIGEYQRLESALGVEQWHMNHSLRSGDMTTPPAMSYDKDAVDYYSLALCADDPFIRYISFYHVLEFYFDSVFREAMAEKLKKLITSPEFSYTDAEKLYGVARAMGKEMHIHRTDYGDERQKLRYVLRKYVNLSWVRTRLDEISPSGSGYYSDVKCPFAPKGTLVEWEMPDKAMTALVKRVYDTRNAFVHSKDYGDDGKCRYRPYKDEAKLREELPLIQALAEQVIIGAGRALEW